MPAKASSTDKGTDLDVVSMNSLPVIYIIDDSTTNLDILTLFLQDRGYELRTFASAEAFMAAGRPTAPGCILLDNVMPGMSGLELQNELGPLAALLPVIFMSGESSYDQVFAASRKGAMAFLQKPLRKDKLLPLVERAVALSRSQAEQYDALQTDQARYAQLSDREKEVFRLLAAGKPNKEVARTLDISLRTAEFHRANVLKKLAANSVSDLIALARRLGL